MPQWRHFAPGLELSAANKHARGAIASPPFMASHGCKGFQSRMVGSETQHVMRQSEIPVLMKIKDQLPQDGRLGRRAERYREPRHSVRRSIVSSNEDPEI